MKDVLISITFILMSLGIINTLADKSQIYRLFSDKETDTLTANTNHPNSLSFLSHARARPSTPSYTHLPPGPHTGTVSVKDTILRVQADKLIDVSLIIPPQANRINLQWLSLPDSTVIYTRRIRTTGEIYHLMVFLLPGEYIRTVTYTLGESTQVSISTKVIAVPSTIRDKFNKQ